MYVCICIHVYIYIYIYTQVCIYTHTRNCVCTYHYVYSSCLVIDNETAHTTTAVTLITEGAHADTHSYTHAQRCATYIIICTSCLHLSLSAPHVHSKPHNFQRTSIQTDIHPVSITRFPCFRTQTLENLSHYLITTTISEQPRPWRKSCERESCYGDRV